MRPSTLATVFAMVFSPFPAIAADVDNGAYLAAENCARCHDIAEGGGAKTMPPSFASIAAFRAEDQIYVRIMFPQMHSPMPAWSMMLSSDEVDDLTAYITSLDPSPSAE
ncbi:MAG: c-type cytochrome [Marinosulfonomonas sp.]